MTTHMRTHACACVRLTSAQSAREGTRRAALPFGALRPGCETKGPSLEIRGPHGQSAFRVGATLCHTFFSLFETDTHRFKEGGASEEEKILLNNFECNEFKQASRLETHSTD